MSLSHTDITVDPALTGTRFACDVSACMGACCTLRGGRGAPLLDEEVDSIMEAVPAVRPHLSRRHLDVLEAYGPVEGPPGDRHTTCVDDEACVFVVYDGTIARCSIEMAFRRGEITWQKPISCHLFPIRIDRGPVAHLRYERIAECEPGVRRGIREDTPLLAFLDAALHRAFGDSWPSLKQRMTR